MTPTLSRDVVCPQACGGSVSVTWDLDVGYAPVWSTAVVEQDDCDCPLTADERSDVKIRAQQCVEDGAPCAMGHRS